MKRKIVFLTGTRADFGKLKSLIQILNCQQHFEVHLFVTGMHLDEQYGYTVRALKPGYNELVKAGFRKDMDEKSGRASANEDTRKRNAG